MRLKKSFKQIAIITAVSLCVGLMVGSLLNSFVWALAAFAITLCVGLSPADFGMARKESAHPLDDDFDEDASFDPDNEQLRREEEALKHWR